MVDINAAHRDSRPLDTEDELRRIERIFDLLDSQFVLRADMRIGLDPIISLVPGIGDAVTARLGPPWHARTRMYGNVVIDALVGLIPVAGDVFDVVFRANRRNLAIARRILTPGVEK